ncbi:MAG: UDP-N-acetylglucosamine--N-acetylmuramyl-(pentapeptide) pyrophosphoryl-undecaprenol N-acetylglucosamine transferase [Brevinematia bacterium]
MKFLVVAGGTGGHISPGIAIYKKLKESYKEVLFVTNPHGLKFPIVKENVESNDLFILPISRSFSKNLIGNLTTLKEFIISIFSSLKLIFSFNPDRVILTGGYVSGPIGIVSTIFGKKVILLEQNSVMGLTNKILSLFAKKVILSFPLKGQKDYPSKYERIGNPIRYSETDILIKEYAKNTYGFSEEDKVLGIILGSQGAKKVNEFILEHIKELAERYKILWITGQDHYEMVYRRCMEEKNIKVFPFINEINVFMSAVDVAISRAGASTLSELSFFGVPTVIIPFPFASKNHQYFNALFFETHGAGIIIEEPDLTIEKLLSALDTIFRNIEIFRSNAKKISPSNATQKVIQKVLDL